MGTHQRKSSKQEPLTRRAKEVDTVCDAFESAWRGGEHPRIEDYLPRVDEPLRRGLLEELVIAELDMQLCEGRIPDRNHYVGRFPQCADVLDFGLAKIAGAEATGDAASLLISATGQIVGTLGYMSPEQAAGRPDEVDMRSDVYALGVVLYELLTGQPPYDVSGPMSDVLQTIQHVDPRPPRSVRRQINDEVETIVLKALAKDKQRRYDTAGALGRDIQRFLEGQPIEAKRDSALYVLRKTLRRYRVPAAIAAVFVALITAAAVALSFLFYRAESHRRIAESARSEAEALQQKSYESLFVSDMHSAVQAWEDANLRRMSDLLSQYRGTADRADIRGFGWNHLWQNCQTALKSPGLAHRGPVEAVSFSPDGATLATASEDTIYLWDMSTRGPGQQRESLEPQTPAAAIGGDASRAQRGNRLCEVFARRKGAGHRRLRRHHQAVARGAPATCQGWLEPPRPAASVPAPSEHWSATGPMRTSTKMPSTWANGRTTRQRLVIEAITGPLPSGDGSRKTTGIHAK